jgi:signal transduction histidine kinase
MVLQDDTGGIWIHLREATRQGLISLDESLRSELRSGTDLEISGISAQGGYMPIVLPTALKVHGWKPVPRGRPINPKQFFAGSDAGERVEVHGVVQAVESVGASWQLALRSDFGLIPVSTRTSVVDQPELLVDAEVRVNGVVGSLFNARGELLSPRLMCGFAGDIVIEKPPPSPASIPLVPLDSLMSFSPEGPARHRVRVQGTVTMSAPGSFFYLQHHNRAIRVETIDSVSFNKGDVVEVFGFIEQRSFIAMLVGAEGRKIGQSTVAAPIEILPREIIEIIAAAKLEGLPAKPHDFDGHLVRFPARLLAVQDKLESHPNSRRLVLDSEGMMLTAELAGRDGETLPALLPDSTLQVTGIVQLDFPEKILPTSQMRAHRLDVFLQNAGDIVVLSKPSWWTPERTLRVLTLGSLPLVGALIWVWQLRRQVNRKTVELATEMRARRDAVIEFDATMRERTRLAANLHDTLLQTMSGLTYQLEACETESIPRERRASNHLETARRMVQRGQEDLRGTVWALRVLPLKSRSLADALRVIVERMQEGHPVTISVASTGEIPAVTEFVAGNLLLIAQEAINNAIKHAQARNITITLGATGDPGRICLEVEDDGIGFKPATAPTGSSDHFGLLGMQERAERLGGVLELQTEPGKGTRIRVQVPLRDFDSDLS